MAKGTVDAAESVYLHLGEVGCSKSTLIFLSRIDECDWYPAIRLLIGSGRAVQTGDKRGATYRRGSGRADTSDTLLERPLRASSTGSAVSDRSYNDLLSDVLQDLDGLVEDYRETSADQVAKRSEDYETSSLMPFAVRNIADSPSEKRPLKPPKIPTSVVIGTIVTELQARGVFNIVDHREKGGYLWVIDGPGIKAAIVHVQTALGVHFKLKMAGAGSSNFAPAWYLVADSPSAQRPTTPRNIPTSAVVGDIVPELQARGFLKIIDNRDKGGYLWVVDGPGVKAAIIHVQTALGVQFKLKMAGASISNFAPAWYLVDK